MSLQLLKQKMERLDATHALDIIAGGDPEEFKDEGVGDSSGNRGIGSQWPRKTKKMPKSRVSHLDDAIDDAIKSGQGTMNVQLSVCP